MSGLIGGRKSKRSEWDQETAFLVDCGTSPTERDSVDWPWTGEEATTQGWVGEGVQRLSSRNCRRSGADSDEAAYARADFPRVTA